MTSAKVLIVLAVLVGGACTSQTPKPAAGVVETTTSSSAVEVTSTTAAPVVYSSCAEATAAGKAPIHKGEPGYSAKLDRDGDGVACDAATTTTTLEKLKLRVGNMTKPECDAYAAKQTGLNPKGPAWTGALDGSTCVITAG